VIEERGILLGLLLGDFSFWQRERLRGRKLKGFDSREVAVNSEGSWKRFAEDWDARGWRVLMMTGYGGSGMEKE
jgi:hypothetical protein